jgi:glutathione peroxidase-family protein
MKCEQLTGVHNDYRHKVMIIVNIALSAQWDKLASIKRQTASS